MNLHSLRSAPSAPVRLLLYAWAAGLLLGSLEGAFAIVVADARSGALAPVCVVGVAMVLGTLGGRPLVRHLGRRRTGLIVAVLASTASPPSSVPGWWAWRRAGCSSSPRWCATSSP